LKWEKSKNVQSPISLKLNYLPFCCNKSVRGIDAGIPLVDTCTGVGGLGAGTFGLGNLTGTALADKAQNITRRHLVQKAAKPRGEISLSFRISLTMLFPKALIRFKCYLRVSSKP
jgi:hypothetical protein